MKTCPLCQIEKDISLFRTRIEKRSSVPKKYVNNVCRECENKESKKRNNHKYKTDFEFREKAKAIAKLNLEAAKKRWLKEKDCPKRKEVLKKWREENKSRVKELHNLNLKKYSINITDSYVVGRLRNTYGLSTEFIRSNTELIELKRNEILLHRIKKLLNEGKSNKK